MRRLDRQLAAQTRKWLGSTENYTHSCKNAHQMPNRTNARKWDVPMIPVASANSKASFSTTPLSPAELDKTDRYWRAANYLSVGQIYLYANPLLREPLKLEHTKPRLLGHWGTTPGLNFIYVHFNRVIKKYDLDVIYICGPGHGGPGMVANTYLEGNLHRALSQHSVKRRRHTKAVQAILLPWRNSQPRRTRDSRID
jgi:hypothetical protein